MTTQKIFVLLLAGFFLLNLAACSAVTPGVVTSPTPSSEDSSTPASEPSPSAEAQTTPPSATATPEPTPSPTAEPSNEPQPTPSEVPRASSSETPTPSAAPVPTPSPTPTPTTEAPSSTPKPTQSPATATPVPTPSPTPTPTPVPTSDVKPTGIKLEKTYIVLKIGEATSVSASVLPAEANDAYYIVWEPTNDLVTLNADGTNIKGAKAGVSALWPAVYSKTTGKVARDADGNRIEVKIPLHVNDPSLEAIYKPYQKEYDVAAIQADMKAEVEARGWTWNPELANEKYVGYYPGVDTSYGQSGPEMLRKSFIAQLTTIEKNDPGDSWSIYFIFEKKPNGEYLINCLRG